MPEAPQSCTLDVHTIRARFTGFRVWGEADVTVTGGRCEDWAGRVACVLQASMVQGEACHSCGLHGGQPLQRRMRGGMLPPASTLASP